jgi:hypothetical protein
MLLARRKFIVSSLLFTASAVLLSENAPSAFGRTLVEDGLSDEVLRDPMYRFTKETFEPYVGGYFEALGARGEMVPMKLVKVASYEPQDETKLSTGGKVETESFSLLFNAEAPLPRFTSIHEVKHGALGEFNLFLTRQDSATREIFYEAVFNHVR